MKRILALMIFLFATTATIAQIYLAQVQPEGQKKWGYLNAKGEFVLEAKYDKCIAFSESGLAIVHEGRKQMLINAKGEVIETAVEDYQLLSVFGFGVKGYSSGLMAVRAGKLWGYLDTKGELAIPAKYNKATVFSDGFAVVMKDKAFFVVNSKGVETAIDIPGLKDVKQFSQGLAPYGTIDKVFGFINTSGKVEISAKFATVGYFVGDVAWAKTADKKVGYINKKGEWLVEPQFLAGKEYDPVSGLARVKIGDSWAYTNMKGEITRIDDTVKWGDFVEGLAIGKKNEKVGFFNNKGVWVIQPEFTAVRDFKNGLAAARKGEMWGFINTKGEWVIEPQFANVKDFELVK